MNSGGNGWVSWGYLLGALAQLVIVVMVVSVCVIMVTNLIVTVRSRWRR